MIKAQVSISPAMAVAMLRFMEENIAALSRSYSWHENLPFLPQEWWAQAEKLPETQAGSVAGMEFSKLEVTKTNDVKFLWRFDHALKDIEFSLVEVWIALFKAAAAKQVPELPPDFSLRVLEYVNKAMDGLRAKQSRRRFEPEEKRCEQGDQQ